MKVIVHLVSGLTILAGAAIAQVRTGVPPPPPQPSESLMPSHDDSDSRSRDSDGGPSTPDKRAAMDNCIAKQQRNHSTMSQGDAQKICRAEIKDRD